MSAPIRSRTLTSAKWATCVEALYETFRKNNGRVHRANFERVCRNHGYNPKLPQAYLESCGLVVEKVTKWKQCDRDVFVWRLP